MYKLKQAAVFAAAIMIGSSAQAAYPERAVQLVIPYGAGAGITELSEDEGLV